MHVFSRSKGEAGAQENVVHHEYDASKKDQQIDLSSVNFENFAGFVYGPGSINLKPFTSLKEEDFLSDFEINLLGNVRFLNKLLPEAKKSTLTPSFVFFSTVASKKGLPMHASIAAAKASVEGFMISMAAEYAPRMRFNCVAPSLTETKLAEKILSNDSVKKNSEAKHPMKRIGSPEDVASAVYYLLSSESSWMTGQVLRPDGGMSL